MREIKFRGYSQYLDEWIYGSSYVDGYIISGVVEANEEYIVIENWVSVEKESVGQYVGLKDVNGNEIYEGDIIEYETIYEWDKNPIKRGEIVFESGFFAPRGVIMSMGRGTVIGNIYENPEILND